MKKIAFVTAWLIISSGWIFISEAWKVEPSYYDVTLYNEWQKHEVHVKVPTQKELDEIKILSKFVHLEYYNNQISYSTQPDTRFKVSYLTDEFHQGFNILDIFVSISFIILLALGMLYLLVGNPFID